MLRLFLTTGAVLSTLAAPTLACQICIPFPKKSAADFLIESDSVVLAREDPERPFHFSSIETLKGEPGDGPIDLFLDSSTRRLLAAHTDRSVVLVKRVVKEEPSWNRIGIADAETEPVVRAVLEPRRRAGRNTRRKRIDFLRFSPRPQKLSRSATLAHLEVARAPYREIRQLRDALPRETIHAFLANVRYVEWHALYILLLAQSENPGRSQVHQRLLPLRRPLQHHHPPRRLGHRRHRDRRSRPPSTSSKPEYFSQPRPNPRRTQGRPPGPLRPRHQRPHPPPRPHRKAATQPSSPTTPPPPPDVANDLIAWKRTELADQVAAYATANRKSLDLQTTLKLRTLRGAKWDRGKSRPQSPIKRYRRPKPITAETPDTPTLDTRHHFSHAPPPQRTPPPLPPPRRRPLRRLRLRKRRPTESGSRRKKSSSPPAASKPSPPSLKKSGAAPRPQQELDGLINEHIREEILYREALALGLDRDDTIVRRRLRQKIEFLSEDILPLPEPTDDELTDYLNSNPASYRLDSQFTFKQVYLNSEEARRHPRRRHPRPSSPPSAPPAPPPTSHPAGDPLMLEQSFDSHTPTATSPASSERIRHRPGENAHPQLAGPPPLRLRRPPRPHRQTHRRPSCPHLDQVRAAVMRDWSRTKSVKRNQRSLLRKPPRPLHRSPSRKRFQVSVFRFQGRANEVILEY